MESTTATDAPEVACTPFSLSTPFSLPGTYVLVNGYSSKMALSLSDDDNKSIILFPTHGRNSQQWEFIRSGRGFTIRSAQPSFWDDYSLYLTLDGTLGNNASIVATTYPVSWHVEQHGADIRISWPTTNFVFDVTVPNATIAPIRLNTLASDRPAQLWNFKRVP